MDQTGSRRIYTTLGEWCKMVFGLVGGKTAVLSSLTLGLFFVGSGSGSGSARNGINDSESLIDNSLELKPLRYQ
jgi:hypothetical protein